MTNYYSRAAAPRPMAPKSPAHSCRRIGAAAPVYVAAGTALLLAAVVAAIVAVVDAGAEVIDAEPVAEETGLLAVALAC